MLLSCLLASLLIVKLYSIKSTVNDSDGITSKIESLDGGLATSEVLLILEVGEHGSLQNKEVSLGSSECETSRSRQLAVACQLQCWTLRLWKRESFAYNLGCIIARDISTQC